MAKCNTCVHFDVCEKHNATVDFDVDDGVCLHYEKQVVRCKDCKHLRHYGKTSLFINDKNIKAGWCQRRIRCDEEYRMTADDFCSYGERKDGDGNG